MMSGRPSGMGACGPSQVLRALLLDALHPDVCWRVSPGAVFGGVVGRNGALYVARRATMASGRFLVEAGRFLHGGLGAPPCAAMCSHAQRPGRRLQMLLSWLCLCEGVYVSVQDGVAGAGCRGVDVASMVRST